MLLALSCALPAALGAEARSAKAAPASLGADLSAEASAKVEARSAKAAAQSTRELRERAADFTYNLDHDEAIKLLRQAIASEPNEPAHHRALASTIWLNILFRRGAVTVDHYLGSFSK